jgi:hypothetical protein
MTLLLWVVTLVLVGLNTYRLELTGGRRETAEWILLGLGALVALAAISLSGWSHTLLMVAAWVGLPFAGRPLVARWLEGKRAPRAAPGARMDRLKEGDLSVDEYYKGGDRASRQTHDRLAALSRQPEIAAVLRRHRLSFRQFCVLREKLALVPEFEWDILSTPEGIEELIELADSGKSPKDLSQHYRSKGRRAP